MKINFLRLEKPSQNLVLKLSNNIYTCSENLKNEPPITVIDVVEYLASNIARDKIVGNCTLVILSCIVNGVTSRKLTLL